MRRFYQVLLVIFFLNNVTVLFAQELAQMGIFEDAGRLENIMFFPITNAGGRSFEDYAIIEMRTQIDQLTYASNDTIIKIQKMNGNDVLYFQATESRNVFLRMSRPGYKSLTINLYGYGISLAKHQAWYLYVSRAEKVTMLNVKIETEPPASQILFGGDTIPIGEEYPTPEGLYEVMIIKEGYETEIDKILVSENATFFKYNLKLPIRIHTIPASAIIYIDEHEKVINNDHAVTPGKHRIEIKWPGYKTIYDSLKVSEEMPENERIFSYKMEPRSDEDPRYTSGYIGGLKIDYNPNPPKLGVLKIGDNFGAGVSLDIPLPIPLLSLTSYGSGYLGMMKYETFLSSESELFFSGNAGTGLQVLLTNNGKGIYAKGMYTYRSISFFDPLESDGSTSYSGTGYSVGAGLELSPQRKASFRLEIMYNFLEFDQVKIYGVSRDLEEKIDMSGLTFSLYILFKYPLFF